MYFYFSLFPCRYFLYTFSMYLLVLKQLVVMLLIVAFSFVFAKLCRFGEKESGFLSRMLLYFVNPCLIFNSFNIPFNLLKLKQLGFSVLVCVCIHLLLTGISVITVHSKDEAERSLDGLDRIGIVFTNCGFIGIPLIKGVFGDGGVFFLMGYLVVFNVYLWTWGEYQMSGHIALKKVFTNPNVIAVIAGILLFCSPVKLPEIIEKSVNLIGGMNTALSMVLLGVLFAGFKKNENGTPYVLRIIKITSIRLIVSSVVVLAFLYGVYKLCPSVPDLREILFIALIASLCPVGMSVPTFACIFDKDATYTSLLVTVTSAVCIVTVPSFVKLAELLIR